MARLTPTHIRQYQSDGYTVLEKSLNDSAVAALRSHVEAIAAGDLPLPTECIEFDPGAPQERHIDNLRKINNPARHD
ncbi:MAG TPA: hypothetical protein EYG11_24870, partial [Candidatus Latescibacteria bacterium]|nr:hypothetical protein [Candidatus Latescibacterota bacterium]